AASELGGAASESGGIHSRADRAAGRAARQGPHHPPRVRGEEGRPPGADVTTTIRVVSLVPSATETLRALGVDPIACTRFCEQPDLPAVGGTKNPDVEAIVALAPDLVVVNDEENRVEDADALVAAGLRVHSMSPRSVADVGPAVVALGDAI